jgi:hypothetical protein
MEAAWLPMARTGVSIYAKVGVAVGAEYVGRQVEATMDAAPTIEPFSSRVGSRSI